MKTLSYVYKKAGLWATPSCFSFVFLIKFILDIFFLKFLLSNFSSSKISYKFCNCDNVNLEGSKLEINLWSICSRKYSIPELNIDYDQC